jgi:hypothetical protein
MKEWDYVLALTENELHSVTIIHDNADFFGANSVVIFTVKLHEYFGSGVRFEGDSKLECLKKAFTSMKKYL